MKAKKRQSENYEYDHHEYNKMALGMMVISIISFVIFSITLPSNPAQGAIIHPSLFALFMFSLLISTMVTSLVTMLMTEKASRHNVMLVFLPYILLMVMVFEFKTTWVFYIIH